MNKLLAFTVVALVSSFATSAFADGATPVKAGVVHGDGYQTADTSDGYSVAFANELLTGDDISGDTPIIKVRPPAARSILIRPRLNFVPELCKSIESI